MDNDTAGAHGGDARLVTMANQIATFFASQPQLEPWRGVAAHLNDFWAPPMRARLLELIDRGTGTGLRPEVLDAGPAIRRPGAPPRAVVDVAPGTPPTREGDEGRPDDPAFRIGRDVADG